MRIRTFVEGALLIEWGTWGAPETGALLLDSLAHARIDGYLLRPSESPDEFFHQGVSSLLHEWRDSWRVATGGWPLDREPLPLETSMPGVFAAGDARHGSVKRVASAVGEGSIAIQLLHRLFAADGAHRAARSPVASPQDGRTAAGSVATPSGG